MTVPEQYLDLTLTELRVLYGGDRRAQCPPELLPWLDVAEKAHAIAEQKRRNDQRERGEDGLPRA